MTIAGFAVVYFYLSYRWWYEYVDGVKMSPAYRTIFAHVFLVWMALGAVEHTTALLGLGAFSAALHFSEDLWNPFHSGYVAGSLAAFVIAVGAILQNGDPRWLQQANYPIVTVLSAGAVMAGTTYATAGRKNPLKSISSRAGFPENRFIRESNSTSIEQKRPVPEDNIATGTEEESPPENEQQNKQTKPTPETDPDESEEEQEVIHQDEKEDHSQPTEDEQASEDAEDGVEELNFPWEDPPETRFQDIGGHSDVKDELEARVIEPLKDKSGSYELFDVVPSRGILFHGPPGTGKTLFARALANELDRPFVELNQSDLTHGYVNKSPQIISRLFEEAHHVGGVIFIDEAEQLLGDRQAMNSHKEDQKITATFLSELTQEDQDFLILLTTNRKGEMDDAILRPGRVEEEFKVGLPNAQARMEIFKVKIADIPHKLSQRQLERIAGQTDGWSGADINHLVNQAKLNAAQREAEYLQLEDVQVGYEDIEPVKNCP